MHTFFTEMRQTILPERGSKDGPLPPLLVTLTFVTGLVDAFSYLVLGHVFVANMTGNVVFLGFALAGAPGFSIGASATALGAFTAGAVIGGRIGQRHHQHRGRLLGAGSATQSVFLAAAVALVALSGSSVTAGYRYALIVELSLAMGTQNAVARKLAIPDLTTTVLTLTLTGVAADSAVAGGAGSRSGRRCVAVAAMLAGALVGAVCVLHVFTVLALAIALFGVLVVGIVTRKLGRPSPAWVAT